MQHNIKPRHFSLDTPTRWNSTYKLLCEVAPYHEVITILYNNNQSSDAGIITNQHWDLSNKVCAILQSFDSATKIFSLVYDPNIHLVITECIKIVSTLTSFYGDPILDVLITSMISKFLSYFVDIPHIYGLGAILDPTVNINGLQSLLEYYYNCLNYPNYIEHVRKYINECTYMLKTLYSEYNSKYAQQNATDNVVRKSKWHDPLISTILKQSKSGIGSGSSGSYSNELYIYLASLYEPDNDDFNILTYWKESETRYPILSKIAKDILACPASTIASESTFSAGKRVLDEKRSSLAPESIKICVLKKDWDKADRRTQNQLQQDDEDDDVDAWMDMDTASETTSVASFGTSAHSDNE